jgi:hypothetical protein
MPCLKLWTLEHPSCRLSNLMRIIVNYEELGAGNGQSCSYVSPQFPDSLHSRLRSCAATVKNG